MGAGRESHGTPPPRLPTFPAKTLSLQALLRLGVAFLPPDSTITPSGWAWGWEGRAVRGTLIHVLALLLHTVVEAKSNLRTARGREPPASEVFDPLMLVHEPDAVESVVPQSRTRCIFCELHLLIADQHLGDKQAEFLRSKYLRGPTLMNQCTR